MFKDTKIKSRISDFFLLSKNKGFPAFDGLRGWAILMVFMAHLGPWVKDMENTFPGSHHAKADIVFKTVLYFPFIGSLGGNIGVDLFFMLSGFLMFYTISKKNPSFFGFLKQRFRRLLPAHITVLLASFAGFSLITILVNIFFLAYFFPKIETINIVTWSLSYELLFYTICALWLIAAKNIKFLKTWKFFFIFILFMYITQGYFTQLFLKFNIKYIDINRFISFFWGLGLAKLYLEHKEVWSRWEKKLQYAAIPGILIILESKYYLDQSFLQNIFKKYWVNAEYFILDLGLFLVVSAMLVSNQHFLKKIFSSIFLRVIGAVSYSFYLIHLFWGLPIAYKIINPLPGASIKQVVFIAVSYVLCFSISVFMFHYLEKPYFIRK